MKKYLFILLIVLVGCTHEKTTKDKCAYCKEFEKASAELQASGISFERNDSTEYLVHQITGIHFDSLTYEKIRYDIEYRVKWEDTSEGIEYEKCRRKILIGNLERIAQECRMDPDDDPESFVTSMNMQLYLTIRQKISDAKTEYKEKFGEKYTPLEY